MPPESALSEWVVQQIPFLNRSLALSVWSYKARHRVWPMRFIFKDWLQYDYMTWMPRPLPTAFGGLELIDLEVHGVTISLEVVKSTDGFNPQPILCGYVPLRVGK